MTPPAWPVEGVYTEVRLYELSTGGFALAVARENGVIVRHEITAEQRATLQVLVTEAMARVGRPATEEDANVISERASGKFMRNQMALAFTLYGGSLASIVDDETASPALYVMAPAATFFIAGAYAKRHPISRAQNHLATDGAFRVALMANGALFALGVKDSPKAYAAATFAGGLTGTVAGLEIGRGMTDGEAHGATWGSTSLAATTFGIIGAAGGFRADESGRASVGAIVAAGGVGFPLGLRYVRGTRYVVTAGDVMTLALAGTLGVAVASTPLMDANISVETVAAALTTGFVIGQAVGDRVLVRPFDHTQGEGSLLWVGASAGALMGGGFAILARSDNATVVMALVTGGAIAGAALTENMIEPRRAGTSTRRRADRGGERHPRISLSPSGLALAAARIPGRASFLTITF